LQNLILRHINKISISFFYLFRPRLTSKFAKVAIITYNKNYKFNRGIKNAEFDADLELLQTNLFCLYEHFLINLKPNADETALKTIVVFFYLYFINIS
jgi:hypothetical protein